MVGKSIAAEAAFRMVSGAVPAFFTTVARVMTFRSAKTPYSRCTSAPVSSSDRVMSSVSTASVSFAYTEGSPLSAYFPERISWER